MQQAATAAAAAAAAAVAVLGQDPQRRFPADSLPGRQYLRLPVNYAEG